MICILCHVCGDRLQLFACYENNAYNLCLFVCLVGWLVGWLVGLILDVRNNSFVTCQGHLLHLLANITDEFQHAGKQLGPISDCSSGSSLIWIHSVCYTDILKGPADDTH